MVALARSFVTDREAAEEVASETWVVVVTSIAGFEGRSRLSTWITGILINKARARASRDRRFRSFTDLARHEANDPSNSAGDFLIDGHWATPVALWDEVSPERIVAGIELWRHVTSAIEALPPAQRAVVLLRDVEGLTNDEICASLGLSEGNARVLLHRARNKLRSVVEKLIGADRPEPPAQTARQETFSAGRHTGRQIAGANRVERGTAPFSFAAVVGAALDLRRLVEAACSSGWAIPARFLTSTAVLG